MNAQKPDSTQETGTWSEAEDIAYRIGYVDGRRDAPGDAQDTIALLRQKLKRVTAELIAAQARTAMALTSARAWQEKALACAEKMGVAPGVKG
jgi:hypothetical protein